MAGAVEMTRRDLTPAALRAAAGRSKDGRAARRMLAIALALEGVDRKTAAERRGALAPDRITRLETLGFQWTLRSENWEAMFTELAKFKQQHGHCNVPAQFTENPQLGRWVVSQRSRRDKLSTDQIERLEALGFQWDVIDSSVHDALAVRGEKESS